MVTRLLSLLVWAAVGASAWVWGLKLWVRGTPLPADARVAQVAPPAAMDLARVLGTPPPQPVAAAAPVAADSRFQLLGVAAPGAGQAGGLALIAVDGKPARTWRVGREVEPGLRLLAVSHRRAELGAAGGPATLTLELPPLAAAQRGALPGLLPGGGAPAGMAMAPMVPMGAMPAPAPQAGRLPGVLGAPMVAPVAAPVVAGGEAPVSQPSGDHDGAPPSGQPAQR